jgi:hypothetical protein
MAVIARQRPKLHGHGHRLLVAELGLIVGRLRTTQSGN